MIRSIKTGLLKYSIRQDVIRQDVSFYHDLSWKLPMPRSFTENNLFYFQFQVSVIFVKQTQVYRQCLFYTSGTCNSRSPAKALWNNYSKWYIFFHICFGLTYFPPFLALLSLLSVVRVKIVAHYFLPEFFMTILKSILLFISQIEAKDLKWKGENAYVVALELKAWQVRLWVFHYQCFFIPETWGLLHLTNQKLWINNSRRVTRVNT